MFNAFLLVCTVNTSILHYDFQNKIPDNATIRYF